ncbi:WYL domain-containing protein [Rossellomorea aquimaris]|uniref:WYL domain-containing protein n=1 Tax=Rossellomorea aquimaris TaxID=189382 RepID=UPI0007D088C0|nr:WYL domain-containing protein [Rossellomorea aquimaris]
MIHTLKRSLEEKRAIEIIYMSHQQFSKRRILVKHLKGEYVVGYCFLRKDIRTFRIQSILAAFPLSSRQDYNIS